MNKEEIYQKAYDAYIEIILEDPWIHVTCTDINDPIKQNLPFIRAFKAAIDTLL